MSLAPRPRAFSSADRCVATADVCFKVDCFLVGRVSEEMENQQNQNSQNQQYSLCFGISHYWKPVVTKPFFSQLQKYRKALQWCETIVLFWSLPLKCVSKRLWSPVCRWIYSFRYISVADNKNRLTMLLQCCSNPLIL